MPSHRLPLSLQVLSKSVFNSLYAMLSESCVQSLSRFQSNLRVISEAFHSILSFPRIWLAGRPASGGRLLNWFLVALLATARVRLWEFTSYMQWLWNYLFSLWLWFWIMWVFIPSLHIVAGLLYLKCIKCYLHSSRGNGLVTEWHCRLHLQRIKLCLKSSHFV